MAVKPLHMLAFQQRYAVPTTGYRGDSVRMALQHFAGCLASGDAFETDGEDYLNQVMRAVFAGYQSAELRKSISFHGDSEHSDWEGVHA